MKDQGSMAGGTCTCCREWLQSGPGVYSRQSDSVNSAKRKSHMVTTCHKSDYIY